MLPFYKPVFACLSMIMMGVIYFALAVSIDSYKLSKYKKKDKNSATWFPKYLEPDNNVLSEAANIGID